MLRLALASSETLLLTLCGGCIATSRVISTGYPVAVASGHLDCAVAVAPLEDDRPPILSAGNLIGFLPLFPWARDESERPDDKVSGAPVQHGLTHEVWEISFPSDFSSYILDAARRFSACNRVVSLGDIPPNARTGFDYLITGQLRSTTEKGYFLTYGLSAFAFAAWLLDAPIKRYSIHLGLRLNVIDLHWGHRSSIEIQGTAQKWLFPYHGEREWEFAMYLALARKQIDDFIGLHLGEEAVGDRTAHLQRLQVGSESSPMP